MSICGMEWRFAATISRECRLHHWRSSCPTRCRTSSEGRDTNRVQRRPGFLVCIFPARLNNSDLDFLRRFVEDGSDLSFCLRRAFSDVRTVAAKTPSRAASAIAPGSG